MASDFDAMRLADLLEHEARAHGPTDYKHKAAAMLRSLATQPTASNAGERLTDEQAAALWQKHLRVSDVDGYSIHGGLELIRAVEARAALARVEGGHRV